MAERKIKDKTYRVEPLTAGDAIVLYADVMRMVGNGTSRLPAIIVGFSSTDDGENLMGDVAALAAIADILKATPSDDLRDLISRIVHVAQVKRPSGVYEHLDLDLDFQDKGLLIPIVKFVMQEQFSDFFTGSAGAGLFRMFQEALQKRRSGGSPQA